MTLFQNFSLDLLDCLVGLVHLESKGKKARLGRTDHKENLEVNINLLSVKLELTCCNMYLLKYLFKFQESDLLGFLVRIFALLQLLLGQNTDRYTYLYKDVYLLQAFREREGFPGFP
jgi:hypothetical protein